MKQSGRNVSPMSNEGRKTYAVEHITDALIEPLSKKSLDEISPSYAIMQVLDGCPYYRNISAKKMF